MEVNRIDPSPSVRIPWTNNVSDEEKKSFLMLTAEGITEQKLAEPRFKFKGSFTRPILKSGRVLNGNFGRTQYLLIYMKAPNMT